MPITAVCDHCQHQFQAPDTFAGKRVKCRHCGQVFQVPIATAPAKTADLAGEAPPEAGHAADFSPLDSLADAVSSSAGSLSGATRVGRSGSLNGGSALQGSRPPAVSRHQLDPVPETSGDDADEADEPVVRRGARRPNFPVFTYPGAKWVDLYLPVALPVLGLAWLAMVASGDAEAQGKPLIQLARFAIPLVLYRAAIFPFLFAGLQKAARELRYRLPPNPKLRAFAAYTPALTCSLVLWASGPGSVVGMLIGLTLGLVLSSIALFVLFRLRESEAATTVAYGAYGFAIGMSATIFLIVGLNYVTGVAVAQAKGQASVPVSPYAAGLPWSAKPPTTLDREGDMLADNRTGRPPVQPTGPTPTVAPQPESLPETLPLRIPPTPPPVMVPVLPPLPPPRPSPAQGQQPTAAAGETPTASASPLLSGLRTLSFGAAAPAGTTVLQTLSDDPVIGLARHAADGSTVVVAWNVVVDRQVGVAITLPAGQVGPPVVDDLGQYLAHIVSWPRRSIRLESLATGRTAAKVDLDPALTNPSLLGFAGPDRLLVQGHAGSDDVSPLGAALGVKPGDGPVIVVVNLTDPAQTRTIKLPPLASTGFPLAVSANRHRLAVATGRGGAPAIVQFNLATGQPLGTAIHLDVDHNAPVAPTGFRFTPDGKRIGILLENAGNAALFAYNADSGGDPADLEFPAPDGIAPAAVRANFKGNALASLDASSWLAYGQRVIDNDTGDVLASLPIDGAVDLRVLAGGRVAVISAGPGGRPAVQVATVDPAKFRAPAHPPAAAQP